MKQAQDNQLSKPLRIVGIDPGSRVSGIACLEAKKRFPVNPQDFKVIDVLTLHIREMKKFTDRLGYIHSAVFDVLSQYSPKYCILEKCFLGKNPQSALSLGQTRGAIIAAIYRHSIEFGEVAPTHVKKIIAGHGHASKEDIARALQVLMKIDLGGLSYDASDALAIALAFGLLYEGSERNFLSSSGTRSFGARLPKRKIL